VSIGLDNWKRLWAELGAATASGGLLNQLVAAYSESHRHYHTLQHLREGLALLDAAAPLARHPAEVELAWWFHDAVYDPTRDDNEERSAKWARDSALAAGVAEDVAQRVQSLVLATRHLAGNQAPTDDPDVRLLLDIDLSILGASAGRFDEYERQVRREYAHLDDATWRAGRRRVLQAFLDRPQLYAVPQFREVYEPRARENLRRSLAHLRP
jgi:predicted metal-dependent HD superfamily phosphohydrolase